MTPHPIPYQGSKRRLAPAILATLGGRKFGRLIEPFAGSAAITLAAAQQRISERHLIGDSLAPLAEIWRAVVDEPEALAAGYAEIWSGQRRVGAHHFEAVRSAYNADGGAARLLYLLARCVKNAPRWNGAGAFNQAPDRRRLGMRQEKMRRELLGASALLRGRTEVVAADFEALLDGARRNDLVYLDPPWEGTSTGRDPRYYKGLPRERLLAALADLDARGIPFLLSYDGRCGARRYGAPLPRALGLLLRELPAGRSSQATLSGRRERTVESLYLSRALRALT